jgi:broad specificity phosphatase PhoE
VLLRDEAFDYAVSSDLARAYDTAVTIRAGAPLVKDERWREFAFGGWEGLTWDEIIERFPHVGKNQWSSAKEYLPERGETFDAVKARVGQALRELQDSSYRNILVVTHAGPLHALLQVFFGGREAEMPEVFHVRFLPGSVTRIVVENGRPHLTLLNEPTEV